MPYDRKNPYYALLKNRFSLNKRGSTKSTYHIVLEIEKGKLDYKVGDSIGCLPVNDPGLVEKVFTHFPSRLRGTSLKNQLSKSFNISKGTKKLLSLIANNLPLGREKTSLLNVMADKHALHQYLEENSLIDILKAYPVTLSSDTLIQCLRPQLPRFYSIASSPLMYPEEIHLTVSELAFTVKKEMRYGVGSRFLCSLINKKEKVGVYIQPAHHFALADENTPIIMVGPGTGIAPFRAFLQERQYLGAKGKNWLFFGERNKAFDFYYQDYFETLVKNRFLRLDSAFSRDTKEKRYVQHKLYENRKELFRWIQEGAHLYLCGDAKHMAKDVEAILLKIFEEEGSLDETKAREYLKDLRRQNRYLTDVY